MKASRFVWVTEMVEKVICARTCLIIYAIFMISFSSPAQQKEVFGLNPNKSLTQYNFDYWDIDNGMLSNTVIDNEMSAEGFMWIATYDGLIKFDGVEFKLINGKPEDDFHNVGVLTIYEDDKESLWVGSNGNGLYQVNKDGITHHKIDTLYRSNIISAIQETDDGSLWIGTRKGVCKFTNGSFIYDHELNQLDDKTILTIEEDRNGSLWIGTLGDGLYIYKDDRLFHYSQADGLNDNTVRIIYEDSQGRKWIGSNYGMNLFSEKGLTKFKLPFDNTNFIINDILEDPFGVMWFATDFGLIKYAKNNFELLDETNGLVDENIQSLAFDREGSLWLGTYRRGIGRLKDGKFRNYGVLEGLANDVINTVYQDNNNIWIGTDDGLSLLRNEQVTSYSLGEGFQQNRIRDIAKDNQGRLWLSTYDGLVHFEDGVVKKRLGVKDGLSSVRLRVLMKDMNGDLWIGSANGLNKYSKGKITQYRSEDGLKNEFIMSVKQAKNGDLWVGTDGGGLHLLKGNKFQNFNVSDGLSSNVIFQITDDINGGLWIGTNSGLTYFDGKDFHIINTANGLYSNTIFQIIIDQSDFCWLTTNKGVQKVSRKSLLQIVSGESTTIDELITYDRSEGMRSSVVTGASIGTLGKDGEIYIPTFSGLTIIDPEEITINHVAPPISISSMEINNEMVNLEQEISIPAGKESIEIHYTGLSLYAPDEVIYEYQLEGFDENWIKAGSRRTAYYTNLPPGQYSFKVRAANNDGIWNEVNAEITFTKEAHFYQQTFFPVLVIFTLILLSLILYKLRTAQLKRQNIFLSNQVDERTKNIQDQNLEITAQKEELKQLNAIKDKLFSIVSHDLRGPLNSFTGILTLLGTESITPEETKSLTKNLEGDLGRLKNLLENLLSWSKTQMQGIIANKEKVPLFDVVLENIQLFKQEIYKKKIKVTNDVALGTTVFADLNMTRLVVRNLINNAIKFTSEDGCIKITAQEKDDFIEVAIQDNGLGIPQEIVEKLFSKDFHYSKIGTSKEDGSGIGLILCYEFIKENGGQIWVESKLNEGSTFKFTFPKD